MSDTNETVVVLEAKRNSPLNGLLWFILGSLSSWLLFYFLEIGTGFYVDIDDELSTIDDDYEQMVSDYLDNDEE